MTEPTTGSNGAQAGLAGGAPQIRVAAQYIKDLSFENPNIDKLLSGSNENPNLNVEVNVNARQMSPELYESAIDFKAQARSTVGVIYDMEVVYCGLFKLENIPQQALEPVLLINCPTLLFPFLRRLVSDVTREGGFPPLSLDPIDFAQLYAQRQQQAGNDNPPA
jgi:preprotein translocase subunit SecB